MRFHGIWLGLGLAASLTGAVAAQETEEAAPAESGNPRVSLEVELEAKDGQVTSLGTLVLELHPDAAPEHVENFLKLVGEGFYEETSFHRVLPGFVVQGGDPRSRADWRSPSLGTGGPGYTLPAEFEMKHVRGAVSAARSGDADNEEKQSNGSQFFVCLADLPSLDAAGYSVFATVVEGMDVVDKIARVPNAGARNQNRALQRVSMKNIHVLE